MEAEKLDKMNVKIKASLERFDKLRVEVEAGEEKLDKRTVQLTASFDTLQVEKRNTFLIRLRDFSMRFGPMADMAIRGLQPHRPKAAVMRPVDYSCHGPPPAPLPRRRSSSGGDARHRSQHV